MQEITPVEIDQVSGADGAEEVANLTDPYTVYNHDWTKPQEER